MECLAVLLWLWVSEVVDSSHSLWFGEDPTLLSFSKGLATMSQMKALALSVASARAHKSLHSWVAVVMITRSEWTCAACHPESQSLENTHEQFSSDWRETDLVFYFRSPGEGSHALISFLRNPSRTCVLGPSWSTNNMLIWVYHLLQRGYWQWR